MPWKDQALMQKSDAMTLSAQSDSLRAHAEVTGKQADMLNNMGTPTAPVGVDQNGQPIQESAPLTRGTGQPDPTEPKAYAPTAKPGQASSSTGQPQPSQAQPDSQPAPAQPQQPQQAPQAPMGGPSQVTGPNYSPYASEMIHTPQGQPAMHPNPTQRIMEIKNEYRVDEKTAIGIMSAEDHGVDPMQYLEYIGQTQGASA